MSWLELFLAALGLLFVMEGMLPFLNPLRFRSIMLAVCKMRDSTLRLMGAAAMLVGVVLLYLV